MSLQIHENGSQATIRAQGEICSRKAETWEDGLDDIDDLIALGKCAEC